MRKCKECDNEAKVNCKHCVACLKRKKGTRPNYLRDRELVTSSVFGQPVDLVDALAGEFGANEARSIVERLYKE